MGSDNLAVYMADRRRERNARARLAAYNKELAGGVPRPLVAAIGKHFVALKEEDKVAFWNRLVDEVHHYIVRSSELLRNR